MHDHPNALEFHYRLRSYLLARNVVIICDFGNTQTDDTPSDIITAELVNIFILGQNLFQSIQLMDDTHTDNNKENYSNQNILNYDDVFELEDITYDMMDC